MFPDVFAFGFVSCVYLTCIFSVFEAAFLLVLLYAANLVCALWFAEYILFIR